MDNFCLSRIVELVTSGVPSFDAFLGGGVAVGDNIVWVTDDVASAEVFERAFLASGDGLRRHLHRESRASLLPLGSEEEPDPACSDVVIDSDGVFPGPEELEEMIFAPEVTAGSRLVISSMDDLVLHWGADAAVDFYTRTCPRLFDRGAIAYWTASRDLVGPAVIDGVTRIAQCVFELRADRLRILKAEGRAVRLQGAVATVTRTGPGPDGLHLDSEHAVGRVGEGLRRLRSTRGMTQAQIAELAGVTPAAISQVESGRRGLSLDSVLQLCESLGTGIDDLVGLGRRPSPWLARHDRLAVPSPPAPSPASVPLFEDGPGGVTVHLVTLDVGQSGEPPFAHKGPEMLLAATGLVLIELEETSPVLRAGDGAMVADVPVLGWTNLGEGPATFFWIALPA